MEKLFINTELTMFKQSTYTQMMGFGIYDGKTLIMIDGGTPGDKDKIIEYINSKGGVVDAWLITHGHFDHIGVLEEILEGNNNITIKNIFVDIFDFDRVKDTLHIIEQEIYTKFVDSISKLDPTIIVKPKLFKKYKVGNYEIEILKELGNFSTTDFNDTGIVYKLYTETEPILFLGDLGPRGGDYILESYKKDDLLKFKTNICQLAHHGQNGVKKSFYDIICPKIALWPTPKWLYDNDSGKGYNTGHFKTFETIEWMKEFNTINITTFENDAIIK